MPERVVDPEEIDGGRRGFLKGLFGSKNAEPCEASYTVPLEPASEARATVFPRRVVLKGAVAVAVAATAGALQGCGIMNATPEGDWFSEPRERFPEHLITLSPEIEATLSPEGRANIVRAVGKQFEYVPKAFWKEITEVRLQSPTNSPEPRIDVANDKTIRIRLFILAGASVDRRLSFYEYDVRESIVEQIGINWYSHLSAPARAIIGTLSPKDPAQKLGEGFKVHLLYPDTMTLMKAYADKYSLPESMNGAISGYDDMRSGVFDEHDFRPPSQKKQEDFMADMVYRRMPGLADTAEHWQSFLDSLQSSVNGQARAFVDYARVKARFSVTINKQFDSESWKSFQTEYETVLKQAMATHDSRMVTALEAFDIDARGYSLREAGTKGEVTDGEVHAFLDKAERFFVTPSDVAEYRDLILHILWLVHNAYFAPDRREKICYWHEVNRQLSQGMTSYQHISDEKSSKGDTPYDDGYCKN